MDDLIPILTRFHREVLLPDIQSAIENSERRLRDEMHAIFDGLAQRLDKLEVEYHMLVAGLKRVEERLDRVEGRLGAVEQRLGAIEQKVEKMALRSELEELRARVDGLQSQIRILEGRLSS